MLVSSCPYGTRPSGYKKEILAFLLVLPKTIDLTRTRPYPHQIRASSANLLIRKERKACPRRSKSRYALLDFPHGSQSINRVVAGHS